MKKYLNTHFIPSSNPAKVQLPLLLLWLLTYLFFDNPVGLMASPSHIPYPANKSDENAVQPTSPTIASNGEEDMTKAILDELQREGHATKKDITPSKKFMIDLFSSLRREEILQNKSEQLSPQTHIHHSDTVRSFSAKVPSSSSRHHRRNRLFYEFFIPVLPEHERTHVVEFRVLNSNSPATTSPLSGDTPLTTRSRRARRSWAVVVKKDGARIYKGTRRYRPIKDGMYDVFDVTEVVAAYLNDNRGNLVIIIKERSRGEIDDDDEDNTEERDSSDQGSSASPGNGLLVLYSRNSHFFHDIYQRFTSGSSPTVSEHRQRRHSQLDGSQRRRLRPKQKEKNRKNRKSTEKDSKQTKRNKSKPDEIPCGRYDYTIDFDVIGWSKWIVAPKKFNAYLCSGSCAFHMEAKHNSSNHAMLQSLMRLKQPDVTPMPCCVPTKLRSISMMYFELGEIVVRKHQDVIAEECGCR